MLITDQVATAPCTDPIQVRVLLLRKGTSAIDELRDLHDADRQQTATSNDYPIDC